MEPIIGGRRQSSSSATGVHAMRDWAGSRLRGADAKLGVVPKGEPVQAATHHSAPDAKEGEREAAELLRAGLGFFCKAWAPEGADFEYKYKRSDALNLLATVRTQAEADALWREIQKPASDILTGTPTREDIRAALDEADDGPGRPYLNSLAEAEDRAQAAGGRKLESAELDIPGVIPKPVKPAGVRLDFRH
jgi:hypothetical protein